MRKLIILFTVLASVLAFQGSIAVPMPREKARTELLVRNQPEEIHVVNNTLFPREVYFVRNLLVPSSPHHLVTSFLVSTQYFHSGL